MLIALEILIAANGYYGGVGLILGGLGMPEEWLDATPFDSWVVPGIALLLSVLCLLAMLWFNPVIGALFVAIMLAGWLYFLATKTQRDRAPQDSMLVGE